VFGGQEAVDGQWPSQMSLEYLGQTQWSHICGAILFKERYAITAAHCIANIQVNRLRLWAGVLNRNNPSATNGQLLPIASYQLHQNYTNGRGLPNNIAIITLLSPADTTQSNVKSALLPPDDTNDFLHKGCFVSGYGEFDSSAAMSESLQWLQMDIIPNQDCATRFQGVDYAEVFPTHICMISDPPQFGPCTGDDGSPLHCYGTEEDTSVMFVAGVLSWNVALSNACNFQYPSVATRLSKYLDWLELNSP